MKTQSRVMTVMMFFLVSCATSVVWAQEATSAATPLATESGMKALAAALSIGLGAVGGALGMGRLVASALDGMARNPNVQGRLFNVMILGLAFVESLVIYALIIAFMIKP